MRRIGFFTTCLLLVSFFMYKPVYSQIEIYNNGNVKMGATGGAAPTEQLELWGDFYVGPDNASNGFWVTKRYNSTDPVLKPQWTNRMWIGSFQDYMRNVVTWELYTHNGGVHTLSDSSIKENVKNLDSAVEKIKKLKPVRYDFKKTFYSNLDSARKVEVLAERKNNVGFVAQDLMKVFPKYVKLS